MNCLDYNNELIRQQRQKIDDLKQTVDETFRSHMLNLGALREAEQTLNQLLRHQEAITKAAPIPPLVET